jgi:hypothetical protein
MTWQDAPIVLLIDIQISTHCRYKAEHSFQFKTVSSQAKIQLSVVLYIFIEEFTDFLVTQGLFGLYRRYHNEPLWLAL